MSYLHRMQVLSEDSLNSVNYECNNDRRTKHAGPSTSRRRPVNELDRQRNDKPPFHYRVKQISQWFKEGKIKVRETVTEGFENTPKAFIGMLSGDNIGKAVVRVN
ncbi:unnamed protein product [Clavelina lepadiformis]|uniref:Uncharacterized protein n=1 Tax=Clavelina lepadiformis TaxID=159417 RepID=A0ABP0GGT1_CLALP